SFIFFLPIYLFGMWASHYKEKIVGHGMKIILGGGVIYIIITALEVSGELEIYKVVGFKNSEPLPYFIFNFSKLKVSLLCLTLISIFYLIRHKPMPLLKTLGEYSFGVYFIHLYIIIAIQK